MVGNRKSGRCQGQRDRRAGFTLVELLVVIVIIGILASLITVAVFGALRYAKNNAMYQEASKVYTAMLSFKDQFGQLPPDGNGGNRRMQRFVQKAFPQARQGSLPPGEMMEAETGPARAIVFWLSEVSTDARQPFRRSGGGFGGSSSQAEEYYKLYEFPAGRIKNGKFFPPDYDHERDPPYLYFNFETYANATYRTLEGRSFKPYDRGQSTSQGGGRGGGNSKEYMMPETCQIVCAGLDKLLGSGGTLMLESAQQGGGSDFIADDDEDNIVNFSTQKVGDIRE